MDIISQKEYTIATQTIRKIFKENDKKVVIPWKEHLTKLTAENITKTILEIKENKISQELSNILDIIQKQALFNLTKTIDYKTRREAIKYIRLNNRPVFGKRISHGTMNISNALDIIYKFISMQCSKDIQNKFTTQYIHKDNEKISLQKITLDINSSQSNLIQKIIEEIEDQFEE